MVGNLEVASRDVAASRRVGGVEPGRRAVLAAHTRLAALDGVRGLAIVLVLGFHVGNTLVLEGTSPVFAGGHLGVHLFFVLSGFLITALLLGEHARFGAIDLPGFARRRVRRLVPAIGALLAVCAVVAVTGTRITARGLVATVVYVGTFTQNLLLVHGDFLGVGGGEASARWGAEEVSHLWSVAAEAQFYLLAALVLWATTRAGWSLPSIAGLVAAGVAAMAVWRSFAHHDGTNLLLLHFDPMARLDAPFVGCLVGIAFHGGWLQRIPRRIVAGAGVVSLVVFLGYANEIGQGDGILYDGLYTVLALCCAAVIAAVLVAPDGRLARVFSWRPLTALGLISYSLYIWHWGVFLYLRRNHPEWTDGARTAVGLAVTLAVGTLSYRFVERPFLRRRAA
jgi:peptidoglycan/LPS O-acetylase OafA/YrhL